MISAWLFSAVLTIAAPISTKASDGGFEAYHVKTSPYVRHAPLHLDNARTRRYRSELAEAATGSVDFAGHYIVTEIGCGAGCLQVAVINATTGKVTWLPGTISNWPKAITEPLTYRRDSSLIIVYGQLNEKGPLGPHRFVLDKEVFRTALK